jgi:hypothetical protein
VSGYATPLNDIRFVLEAVAGLSEIAALPGYEAAASPETVDAILTEAAKFAGDVLAPLNVIGDRERCHLDNGAVHTATGFKDAYDAFVAGGWNGLALPKRMAGKACRLRLAWPCWRCGPVRILPSRSAPL